MTNTATQKIGLEMQQGNSSKVLMDYCEGFEFPDGSGGVVVLSDGMGGYLGGEIASKLAVRAVMDACQRNGASNARRTLEEAFFIASEEVRKTQEQRPELGQMGCTLVAAVNANGRLTVCHVGDSRAVLHRNNYLLRLTKDHLAVVERDGVSDAAVKSNPEFRQRANVLSRYIGGPPPVPDYEETDVQPGDIIFLASDGITEYLLEDRINFLLRQFPPQEAAVAIVREAIQNRSHDHCSVAIFRV